jgi:hypothetical protein
MLKSPSKKLTFGILVVILFLSSVYLRYANKHTQKRVSAELAQPKSPEPIEKFESQRSRRKSQQAPEPSIPYAEGENASTGGARGFRNEELAFRDLATPSASIQTTIRALILRRPKVFACAVTLDRDAEAFLQGEFLKLRDSAEKRFLNVDTPEDLLFAAFEATKLKGYAMKKSPVIENDNATVSMALRYRDSKMSPANFKLKATETSQGKQWRVQFRRNDIEKLFADQPK